MRKYHSLLKLFNWSTSSVTETKTSWKNNKRISFVLVFTEETCAQYCGSDDGLILMFKTLK